MENIMIISPFIGIGTVKLGMSQSEVHEILKDGGYLENLISRCEYDENDKLKFIEISNPFDEFDLQLLYDGIDVFKTKANSLVEKIDEKTPYFRNEEAEMGVCYTFKDLQLSFWRPSALTEDEMNSVEFLEELSPENQEYEKRNLYFSAVAIASKGYY
ncbi:hypothetical protein J45TS6_45910 [Paenibacillus sp. J45TS6]|nr:hypothetical protein [Paenibacillus sp. J45TS6]BCO11110.1 hypothetical protein [Paenibacillus sp.]GIP46132.1 hypothetical protein J45TS6_45910 [Paenibacillus sp. J45TS6]